MTAFQFGDIIFLAVWTAFFLIFPKTRKLQLFGSLLLIPFGLLDVWFRPEYWNPPLLIKVIEPFSIETPIYCFCAGGIAAVIGSFFVANNHEFKLCWRNIFLFLAVGFFLFAFFKSLTNLNAMNCLNFSFLIVWVFLVFFKVKNGWRSIASAVIFGVFTIGAVSLGLIFFPNFVSDYWNLSKNWPLFLNTPTEEIFFAGVLGALWAILPKYLKSC